MKKQPIWKIILVIIIAVLLIKFVKDYSDKEIEENAQRAVDRMMEIKKQAVSQTEQFQNRIVDSIFSKTLSESRDFWVRLPS